MRGTLGLRRVSLLLLFVAACGAAAGCPRGQPPQPSPPPSPSPSPSPPAAQPYTTSFSASGWTYHLRPLKPEAKADADKAKEVWRDLFAGMAKDPKTRDLLKKLYADLPVQFAVLDANRPADMAALTAPPPEGCAIAMRVADISHKDEKSKAGTVPVRVIAFGYAVLIKDAAPPASLGALAEDAKKEPSGGAALNLAMEDYVQRHAPGWAVIGGPFFEDEKLPGSAEEQRPDLDQRVTRYEEHAKAFFGARRKP